MEQEITKEVQEKLDKIDWKTLVGIPEQCRPVIPAQKGENDARSPIKNR